MRASASAAEHAVGDEEVARRQLWKFMTSGGSPICGAGQARGGDGLPVAFVLFVGSAEFDAFGECGKLARQDFAGLGENESPPSPLVTRPRMSRLRMS